MEPTSALGAAGSVVGIASFGVQLSRALYPFTNQPLTAKESLQTALNEIHATTCALDSIHAFLAEECKRLEERGHASLILEKAIKDVKGTADKCLVIFWRIEAAITNQSGSNFESSLIERLKLFNAEICKEQRQPMVPDPKLTRPSTWRRLRWLFVAPKLDRFNKQLQLLQTNLVLMFQVISFGTQRRRSKPRQHFKTLHNIYSLIQRMPGQADVSQIEERWLIGANGRLAASERRRLEIRVPARDNFHPFMPPQSLSPAHGLTPRRRQLSTVVSDVTHTNNTRNGPLPQTGDGWSGGFVSGYILEGCPA